MKRIPPKAPAGELAIDAAETSTSDARTKANEAELRRFQGDWKLLLIEDQEGRATREELASITVLIKGDRFTLRSGSTTNGGILTLDPAANPKMISVTFSVGPNQGKTSRGIYELEGDLLKVCNGAPDEERPTGFACEPGSGHTLQFLKRVQPQGAQTKTFADSNRATRSQSKVPQKLIPWVEAKRRHRLTDEHVQMARELGMNPKKLGKLDNHRQETWKLPLRDFIVQLYHKRFKRLHPERVIRLD